MKTIYYKDINIGQSFFFGEIEYVKVDGGLAISLAGPRIFNPMEIISV